MRRPTRLATRSDVIGLTVPGRARFPALRAHSQCRLERDHAFVDIHDLYVEKFDAGARTIASRTPVLPATHRAETIKVRDGEDVTIDVVRDPTRPHHRRRSLKGYCLALKSVAVRRSRYIVRLHAAHVARAIGRAII